MPRSVYATIALAAVAACYSGGHGSATKEANYHLNIQNAEVVPDGFTRSVVSANGTVPGPLISGTKGDRFLVNVTDSLTDKSMMRGTSIHWHGIYQRHSNLMDGAAEVNQCPIIPGNSFLYNFSVPDQAGTFWYHSHFSNQYCDGLSGPLVIYDPHDPLKHLYDVDDESTVITLQDWYHRPSPSIFPNWTTPNSTLINGLGRRSDDPSSELAVIHAKRGKRYRFRLINTGCFPSFTFSIDGHKLTVIEADGIETRPHTVDSLEIYSSQRYSVVVTMDKPIDNYWIRAIPSVGNNSTANGVNSAILRYHGAPNAEPCEERTNKKSRELDILNEADLHPLINPGAPGEPYPGGADVVLTLQHGFGSQGGFVINNATFMPPSVPVLLQILSGNTNANSLLPKGSIYGLPRNKVIEIIIPGGGLHPFHLHGHTFDVIRVANSTEYNYVNPVRRDVVSVGNVGDEVTLRFVTDNPGPWFLHCHIDWHLAGGLAVVLAEAAEDVAQNEPDNSDWDNLCPLYNKFNPDKHFESIFYSPKI
ncbi:type-2 Cu-depleted laccase [Fomitiporia mediterranea MF3/22]|uniref:type-2 Cu-depleted laccase n=1 Tax=Fomitiporia mediterranea (strain MF3/22) TaxID=694068 RepID=UPI0004408DD1|nr:type-2 Cu-depleted laccase [Fomitiporia mediterranea MF3/22]EJC98402.1 type-2 Cu-depleted laccase [Fomitiporia mediterranea MF3/22]